MEVVYFSFSTCIYNILGVGVGDGGGGRGVYILLRGGEGDLGEFYIFRPGLFISLGNLLCEEGGRGGLISFFYLHLSIRAGGWRSLWCWW